jgi:hypothetical protein
MTISKRVSKSCIQDLIKSSANRPLFHIKDTGISYLNLLYLFLFTTNLSFPLNYLDNHPIPFTFNTMKFILAATALAIVSSTAVLAKECKLPYVGND